MGEKFYSYEQAGDKLLRPKTFKTPLKEWLIILLFHENPLKSQIRGIVVGCVILWWIIKHDVVPLFVFIILSLSLNLIGMIYWKRKMKDSEIKIKDLEKQMHSLNDELKQKQEYFKKSVKN